METRKHLAAEKKRCNSHTCAQAVVCTYCDLVGLSEETARDIAGAYGTGMGNMEGTCGALVGAGMILGLATKDRDLSRNRMKTIMTQFQERNGATQCKLLKGVGTGKPLRDCPGCVQDASEFLEKCLWETEPLFAHFPIELSGTLMVDHYYETGELPTDELERKLFLLMIENGEI